MTTMTTEEAVDVTDELKPAPAGSGDPRPRLTRFGRSRQAIADLPGMLAAAADLEPLPGEAQKHGCWASLIYAELRAAFECRRPFHCNPYHSQFPGSTRPQNEVLDDLGAGMGRWNFINPRDRAEAEQLAAELMAEYRRQFRALPEGMQSHENVVLMNRYLRALQASSRTDDDVAVIATWGALTREHQVYVI